MNRLKLDWALSTSTERTEFAQQYITQDSFLKRPLTEEELETIANYILWGKNENGTNVDQDGLVELPRKNSTWSTQNVESLDELTENPSFNENSIYSLDSKLPTKKTRKVFSREETRKTCPNSILVLFENLWKQIDRLDLIINYYELKHEKRQKEPRAELLNNFSEDEILKLKEKADSINQFKYLKMRHLLVELRSEQYTLRDSYTSKILHQGIPLPLEHIPFMFESDVQVFPFGLKNQQEIKKLVFKDFEELIPKNFNTQELYLISKFYWEKENNALAPSNFSIDFEDLETVYQIFLNLEDLQEPSEELYNNTNGLLNTLNYYIEQSNFTEVLLDILERKIKKEKNQDIAIYINKKYGKTYTANYISTIFRQKIIPTINETARYHKKIIGNLFFEEEFKKCTKCGRVLLRDPINFVRKSRAKDGLSNHCKNCDKKEREEKKIKGGE